jgi:hypothetical protein
MTWMRKGRPNKFNAKRTHCSAGHEHASKKEAAKCNDLRLLEMAGEISHLEVEPFYPFCVDGSVVKHPNGRRVGMKPDFSFRERGNPVALDIKGGMATQTEAYVLRRTLFRAFYPQIEFREE